MATSYFVLGSSGSGKTTYTRVSTKDAKNIFVVNGPEFSNCTHITFDKVESSDLENGTIIFDDVILPTGKQVSVLKKILLYTKRHKRVNVYVLSHSITNNGTYELLVHFDVIVITQSESNQKLFHDFCRVLHIDKLKARNVWRDFISRTDSGLYLEYKTSTKTFEVILKTEKTEAKALASSANPEEVKRKNPEEIRREVFKIMSGFPHTDIMMSLYDHIFQNYDINSLHPTDLAFNISSSSGEAAPLRANICDLLYYLTTPGTKPRDNVILLFQLLSKHFSIPDLFVRNSAFRQN